MAYKFKGDCVEMNPQWRDLYSDLCAGRSLDSGIRRNDGAWVI